MMNKNEIGNLNQLAQWLRKNASEVAFTIGQLDNGDPFYLHNEDTAKLIIRDKLEAIRKLADRLERGLSDE